MPKEEKPICGIVMPISTTDETHTDEHWARVQKIVSEAIEKAGCKPQPVWEGLSHDIIHEKIFENLYENPIAVCDLSTRNPNVMMEIGMRLTTKKPTLLIAEHGTDLPFDTKIIHTEFYDSSLEYSSAKAFIETLQAAIANKLKDAAEGKYRPYLESFQFETVEPNRVSVSADEHLLELVEVVNARLARMERSQNVQKEETIWAGLDPRKLLTSEQREASLKHSLDLFGQKIEEGDIVLHSKFGGGMALNLKNGIVDVDFDKIGLKRIEAPYLKVIEKG